ncbi:hypothetical protein [Paracoccus ravus]|uniref:hypothetical protein n=1 Tax=Paracoccus ravus TaxID=2447760 RepID=UPI00106DE659|nr:hypothetical protein [Paracoccus ravus]
MTASTYFVRNLKVHFALPGSSGERLLATFDLIGRARPMKGCRLIVAADGRQFVASPVTQEGGGKHMRVWNAHADVTRRAMSAYGYTMRQAMKGGRANV